MVNVGGRPTIFNGKVARTICERISHGESLRKITKEPEMPAMSTVMKWLANKEMKGFIEQYEDACNTRAEMLFEEIEEIADDENKDVQRSRLRVDTRKWYLSKVLPKKFGDKLDLTTLGDKLPTPILGGVSKKDEE